MDLNASRLPGQPPLRCMGKMPEDGHRSGDTQLRDNRDADHGRRSNGMGNAAPLYTPEERVRRDATVWTMVQGVLAPLQFLVFLVSLVLVLRYLVTGEGYWVATVSVVIKTVALYVIMVTGSIWEKVVFGKWLFVPAFFWEDVFSMLVLALHTAYLYAVFTGALGAQGQMGLALAAYGAYVINAGQFVWKLRMARLQGRPAQGAPAPAQPSFGGAS